LSSESDVTDDLLATAVVALRTKLKLDLYNMNRTQNIGTQMAKSRSRAGNFWGDDDTAGWTGITLKNCTTMARDRKNWREVVNASICDLQQSRSNRNRA